MIIIYGTGSIGVFDPQDDRALPDANGDPRPDVLNARLNKSFEQLTRGIQGCRVLTFSYDDKYLAPPGGAPSPGLLAWNKKDAPWDTDTDTLATNLQRLMDSVAASVPNAKFDMVAYSAGGSVPTYWAARSTTTDAARARVHSITVIDGIVSGAGTLAEIACVLPGVRQHFWDGIGRLPCHFRGSDTTRLVVVQRWPAAVPLGTLRAQGDRVVWHEWAGLPGHTVAEDPELHADWFCNSLADLQMLDFWYCLLWKGHGTVLHDPNARAALERMISR
jgi:hypothetical protein